MNTFRALCDHALWLRAAITLHTLQEYDIMEEPMCQARKAVVPCSRG